MRSKCTWCDEALLVAEGYEAAEGRRRGRGGVGG